MVFGNTIPKHSVLAHVTSLKSQSNLRISTVRFSEQEFSLCLSYSVQTLSIRLIKWMQYNIMYMTHFKVLVRFSAHFSDFETILNIFEFYIRIWCRIGFWREKYENHFFSEIFSKLFFLYVNPYTKNAKMVKFRR